MTIEYRVHIFQAKFLIKCYNSIEQLLIHSRSLFISEIKLTRTNIQKPSVGKCMASELSA